MIPHITRMTFTSRLVIIFAMLAVVLGAAWFGLTRGDTAQLSLEAVTGPRPKIDTPRVQYIPTVDIARPVGWTDGAMPTPAPGLAVTAFAKGLDHPRWLYELPNGDVLVAETNSPPRETKGVADVVMTWLMSYAGAGVPSANRITLLRDTNGDGVADARSALLTGLNSPFGMALIGDRLYIANHDGVVAYPFTPGQTKITAAPEKIVALPGGGNHWAKNIVPSADGKSLYISVGSTSNIAEGGIAKEKNRANILELDLATKRFRIYTAGLRNPVGMAWEPAGKRLWTVVNERDMLGSDLAPDYLAVADFGAFYGWPYSYWGGYVDPRVKEPRPGLLQYTKRPEYALGPHTASLGLAFGSLGNFQKGAFIGQHGSWNRKPPSGYKVTFVPFNADGLPNGRMQDVLTGFLDKNGRAQGRPVGVIADSKGGLLVADDVGNVIWRVTGKAPVATAAR
jgi:glucose/arabinose dehydrogenase